MSKKYYRLSRRDFIRQSVGLALSAATCPSSLLASTSFSQAKNIVFIISDQHRYDVVGCYGNPVVETPNIDQLASEGVRFENMYCQSPLCVPSRQSIITSQYMSTHGTFTNTEPEEANSLIEYLHDFHGVQTQMSGKCHMSQSGFDTCVWKENLFDYLEDSLGYTNVQEIIQERSRANRWYENRYKNAGSSIQQKINSKYLRYPLDENYYTESLFYQAAKNLLENRTTDPQFLWISFNKPHPQWVPPEDYFEKYNGVDVPYAPLATSEIISELPEILEKRYYLSGASSLRQDDIINSVRSYYGCIEYIDHLVGQITGLITSLNLDDETVVVYTSDHGEMLAHHGLYFKRCFYEPAVHIPCIIRFPGVIPAGQTVSQLTESIDIMPTLLDYAGLQPAGTEQGSSMKNLITNPYDTGWKNIAFSELVDDQGEVMMMCRAGRYKYVYYPNDQDQLFDLENDPAEISNLVGNSDYADVIAFLKECMDGLD